MRTIIITGCSRGIGEDIAKLLLAKGFLVVGLSRTRPEIEDTRFTFEPVDLSDLKNLKVKAKELVKKYPETSGIILNAGKGIIGHLEQYSFEEIQDVIELNLISPIFLVKAFLPLLKTRQQGHVIFIGSEAALEGKRNGSVYCASKFGLRGFVQAIREECSLSSVGVTLINPGIVDTSFFENLPVMPGKDPLSHLKAEDISIFIPLILQQHPRCVVEEINLSPMKQVIEKKPPIQKSHQKNLQQDAKSAGPIKDYTPFQTQGHSPKGS